MEDVSLNNSFTSIKLDCDHKDMIHDVSFDYFGKRLATCSSDQSVKVWDLNDDNEWVCSASWKTHSASVWKVTWAHPEFGQVLATCSFDRTTAVWEETLVENPGNELNHIWIHKANLVDSRTSVKDVKFSPKHLGLQLATCSANGVVRIYEAHDVMNLTQWSMQHELECKMSCCCISWNNSTYRYHAPMIAVGSDDANTSAGGKVFIFEYNDSSREWTKVHTIMKITEPVNDLSFSPNMGRKHHILGIASQDLHIYYLRSASTNVDQPSEPTELSVQPVALFSEHNCKVTRLSWNDLGTILLSTGDNGKVFLWMANYVDTWKRVGTLKNTASTPMEYSLPYHSTVQSSDASAKNNRINFRRFMPHREPPPQRPIDPRYAGAYY